MWGWSPGWAESVCVRTGKWARKKPWEQWCCAPGRCQEDERFLRQSAGYEGRLGNVCKETLLLFLLESGKDDLACTSFQLSRKLLDSFFWKLGKKILNKPNCAG